MVNVFAYYFPQFYPTKENSIWWGENFTDWILVQQSQSLFKGHQQPHVPLNGYYNQSEIEVVNDQINLAVEYGLAGFNVYHYWFNNKPYLDIPLQHMSRSKNEKFKFFITWANESWTRQWIGKPHDILLKQTYANSHDEVVKHYVYLREFFHSPRYSKIDNKPVFSIYRPEMVKMLNEYMDKLNQLAIDDGFDGIHWLGCRSYHFKNEYDIYKGFNGIINFNPRYISNTSMKAGIEIRFKSYLRVLPEFIQHYLSKFFSKSGVKIMSYDQFIDGLLEAENLCYGKPVYQSIVPNWDNTARYNRNATLFVGTTKEKFLHTFDISLSKLTHVHENFIFINAWNEWSESAYLEPDKKNQHSLLLGLKDKILKSTHN
ncbi:glycoside hydrolase family 99-like domain-containing protein [Aeromonas hydrophila]|uniref:Glycoside hydrolase family 99-like domain-containing protein n=1 Tax=Aeromonas hydrophila TaxID=644 RepID=A0AAX3P0W2_AERHY|nr:glycoside hydrolase family 99-like domain-containing protein [Aeromonas hydrophila]WEE24652.1 glycoside hydrolase family 99-like domain-containing protein [Aeromonas hydrophila]